MLQILAIVVLSLVVVFLAVMLNRAIAERDKAKSDADRYLRLWNDRKEDSENLADLHIEELREQRESIAALDDTIEALEGQLALRDERIRTADNRLAKISVGIRSNVAPWLPEESAGS